MYELELRREVKGKFLIISKFNYHIKGHLKTRNYA